MKYESVSFKNSGGKRMSARVFRPGDNQRRGVIFCHGLLSSQEGYKISRLSDDIVGWGYNLLTFDFSSAGDPANITIQEEIDDLEHACVFFSGSGVDDIHILGSSMGGTVALLAASGKDLFDEPARLMSVITMATPVDLKGLKKKFLGRGMDHPLSSEKTVHVEGMELNARLVSELDEIDVIGILDRIPVPVLSFHGMDDETVDYGNLRIIKERLKTAGRQVEIEGGDHSLCGEEHLEIIRVNLQQWFGEF